MSPEEQLDQLIVEFSYRNLDTLETRKEFETRLKEILKLLEK